MASASEEDFTEREFLGSFVKKQIKYGSTANHVDRFKKILTHNVQPSDTLQGLSLRYGVPMEHIKRINKMWTSDSLCLRPTLKIPISDDTDKVSPFESATSSKMSSRSNSQFAIDDAANLRSHPSSSSTGSEDKSLTSPSGSLTPVETNDHSEVSVLDFLSRIDSSITQTKCQVYQTEGRLSESNSKDDLFRFQMEETPVSSPSSRIVNRLTNGHRLNGSTSGDDSPTVMQSRIVMSSLKRLEQHQDELFEL
ncbi:LysM and putative peptidoglycan-binding domain-containing protein 1 [Halotydeus destructor]|nr:LysM and putative peptidoglycan-binding domain-containing protein 1 [Halotydeus destructor]